MKRLGIFGGSFNPPHYGHLLAAQAAKEKLGLDELVVVPCRESADGKRLLPGLRRLGMLRAALRGLPGFSVDDLELKRPGVSRSIDTVREFEKRLGNGTKLFLIIGEDQAQRFPRWHEALELSRRAQVCVLARPPYRISAALKRRYGFRYLAIPKIEISSALIWERKRLGLPLRWLAPEVVLKAL